MPEGNISTAHEMGISRARELVALEEALFESAQLDGKSVTTLHQLNLKKFFIVADTDLYNGPKFSAAEIDTIQELAQQELEDGEEEVRLALDCRDYESLSKSARRMAFIQAIDARVRQWVSEGHGT